MEYTITCDGISIGTAWLAPLAGLAHAEFRSLPAESAKCANRADAAANDRKR
jgi:hypothetical protein